MRVLVCVDIDGVVLNFLFGLERYLGLKGYYYSAESQKTYAFTRESLGYDPSVVYDAFKEPSLYSLCPLYDGVSEAARVLTGACQVQAYTSVVDIPEIKDMRRKLCHSLGFGYVEYVYRDKPVVFEADALFEDDLSIIKKWIDAGSNAKIYLIDHTYNQPDSKSLYDIMWRRVIRCNSFKEAVEKYVGIT